MLLEGRSLQERNKKLSDYLEPYKDDSGVFMSFTSDLGRLTTVNVPKKIESFIPDDLLDSAWEELKKSGHGPPTKLDRKEKRDYLFYSWNPHTNMWGSDFLNEIFPKNHKNLSTAFNGFFAPTSTKDKLSYRYPKIGINPLSRYDTPNGIYSYPVNIYWDFPVPFRGDSPWVWIFKPKVPNKILWDIGSISPKEFKSTIDKLVEIFGESAVDSAADDIADHSNLGKFLWGLTRLLAGKLSGKRNIRWPILWNALGYEGVVDEGMGIIHENEPAQAVFWLKNYIDVIDVIDQDYIFHRGGNYNSWASRSKPYTEPKIDQIFDKLIVDKFNKNLKIDLPDNTVKLFIIKNKLTSETIVSTLLKIDSNKVGKFLKIIPTEILSVCANTISIDGALINLLNNNKISDNQKMILNSYNSLTTFVNSAANMGYSKEKLIKIISLDLIRSTLHGSHIEDVLGLIEFFKINRTIYKEFIRKLSISQQYIENVLRYRRSFFNKNLKSLKELLNLISDPDIAVGTHAVLQDYYKDHLNNLKQEMSNMSTTIYRFGTISDNVYFYQRNPNKFNRKRLEKKIKTLELTNQDLTNLFTYLGKEESLKLIGLDQVILGIESFNLTQIVDIINYFDKDLTDEHYEKIASSLTTENVTDFLHYFSKNVSNNFLKYVVKNMNVYIVKPFVRIMTELGNNDISIFEYYMDIIMDRFGELYSNTIVNANDNVVNLTISKLENGEWSEPETGLLPPEGINIPSKIIPYLSDIYLHNRLVNKYINFSELAKLLEDNSKKNKEYAKIFRVIDKIRNVSKFVIPLDFIKWVISLDNVNLIKKIYKVINPVAMGLKEKKILYKYNPELYLDFLKRYTNTPNLKDTRYTVEDLNKLFNSMTFSDVFKTSFPKIDSHVGKLITSNLDLVKAYINYLHGLQSYSYINLWQYPDFINLIPYIDLLFDKKAIDASVFKFISDSNYLLNQYGQKISKYILDEDVSNWDINLIINLIPYSPRRFMPDLVKLCIDMINSGYSSTYYKTTRIVFHIVEYEIDGDFFDSISLEYSLKFNVFKERIEKFITTNNRLPNIPTIMKNFEEVVKKFENSK